MMITNIENPDFDIELEMEKINDEINDIKKIDDKQESIVNTSDVDEYFTSLVNKHNE